MRSIRDARARTVEIGVLFLLAFVLAGVGAQADEPRSRTVRGLAPLDTLPVREMPPVDVSALLAEDAAQDGKDVPPRVGYPRKVDLSPANSGTWEDLADGDRLWRLQVRSARALWVVLGFGTYRLQPGGELWVYAPDGHRVLGPYTSDDVREHGQLWFPPIAGDTLVVELYWPAALKDQEPALHLGTLSHGYLDWGGVGISEPPTAASGACNNDVNCPLGANWQDEKRGVINLLSGGSGYCSGSLIASTDQDCRNFVLTARHCVSSASGAAGTTFQFNFERPACNSGTAPTTDTVTGSVVRASYGASDVTLLEMDVAPPDSFNVFYNGWSRSTTPGTESWAIHHPSNDEKAISFNEDPLVDGQNYGPDHWRINQWEDGTTEPGSSGSPLFDQNHRIVGQLHGGQASCTNITWDEYGKFDVSWNGGGTPSTRVKDWLDSGNTGAITQDGFDYTFCQIPQPRLKYRAFVVDDTAGNGDGIVDPGETFVLEVDLVNEGTLDATQVGATMTSVTSTVTLTDDVSAWPDIPQGDSVRRSSPPHFTVELDGSHACGAPLDFHLDITAAESPGAWAADFQVPTGTPNVSESYRDEMESGTNGWTTQTLSGNNPWSQSTARASTPVTSWYVSDIGSVSDSVLEMPVQVGLPAGTELRFQHRINAENNYDGGVLEYSTDAGSTWTDAGPLITQGAYTTTISTGYSSPIGGRQAWSGDNGAFQEVRVDLSSLAGSDLILRWRFATDSSVSDEGWYVDDVVLEATSYTCNAPLAVPGEASDPDGTGLPFTIEKDPGGFLLRWSAPVTGGPAESYRLYRTDPTAEADPECEADLGTGTSAVLPTLPDGYGLLVVARNAAGEGELGEDSSGAPRPPSAAPCP